MFMTSRCVITLKILQKNKYKASVSKARAFSLCSYIKSLFLLLISVCWLLEAAGSAGVSATKVAPSLGVILCDTETAGYTWLHSFNFSYQESV